MLIHVFACDYDGTIAEYGRVSETTAALERVRESGRKVVLVTGRTLQDLQQACPDHERMFDAIVGENGAVLYLPRDCERSGHSASRRRRRSFRTSGGAALRLPWARRASTRPRPRPGLVGRDPRQASSGRWSSTARR